MARRHGDTIAVPEFMFLGSKLSLGFRKSWDEGPEGGLFKRKRLGAELADSQSKKGEHLSGCSSMNMHGGGAENRTPVQSHPLAGVSKLSHHKGFGHVTRGDPQSVP